MSADKSLAGEAGEKIIAQGTIGGRGSATQQCLGHRFDVMRFNQIFVTAGKDFRHRLPTGRDHRATMRHGLGQHQAEAFRRIRRGKNKTVGVAIKKLLLRLVGPTDVDASGSFLPGNGVAFKSCAAVSKRVPLGIILETVLPRSGAGAT